MFNDINASFICFLFLSGKLKYGTARNKSRVTHSSFSAAPAANSILTQTQIRVLAARLSFPSDSLKIPFPVGICQCVLLLTLVTTKSLKPWPSESNSKTQAGWRGGGGRKTQNTRQIQEKYALDFYLKKEFVSYFLQFTVVHECVQGRKRGNMTNDL